MLLGKIRYDIKYCPSGRLTVTENGQEATITLLPKHVFLCEIQRSWENFSFSPYKLNFANFSHPQKSGCINKIFWEVILKNSAGTYWKKSIMAN